MPRRNQTQVQQVQQVQQTQQVQQIQQNEYNPLFDVFDENINKQIKKDFNIVGVKASNLIARYEKLVSVYGNKWINHMFSTDFIGKPSKGNPSTIFRNLYYINPKDESMANRFILWGTGETNYGGLFWPEKPTEEQLKQTKIGLSFIKYKQYVRDKDYSDTNEFTTPGSTEPQISDYYRAVEIISMAHVKICESFKGKYLKSTAIIKSKIRNEKTDKNTKMCVKTVPKFAVNIKLSAPQTEIIVIENGEEKNYTGIPIDKVATVIKFGDEIARIESSAVRICDSAVGVTLSLDVSKIIVVQRKQQKIEYDEEEEVIYTNKLPEQSKPTTSSVNYDDDNGGEGSDNSDNSDADIDN